PSITTIKRRGAGLANGALASGTGRPSSAGTARSENPPWPREQRRWGVIIGTGMVGPARNYKPPPFIRVNVMPGLELPSLDMAPFATMSTHFLRRCGVSSDSQMGVLWL